MQMQIDSKKGNDRNESITSQITTMRTGSVCSAFLDTEETHSVVCTVPPPQASFSKDEEQCTHCPQPGAQEEGGLRGHTGGPGRTMTKIQTSVHSLPRAEVPKAR